MDTKVYDHTNYCRISYWRDNKEGFSVSCSKEDEWTRCDVAPLSTYSSYGTQSFKPGQEHQMGSLIFLLNQAYAAGRRAKALSIKAELESY